MTPFPDRSRPGSWSLETLARAWKAASPSRAGLLLAAAFLFATAASPAHAHSVWIEPTKEGQLVLRFGEPGEEIEKSPGHLDSVSPPVAFGFGTNGTPQTVEAPKRADHFLLTGLVATRAAGAEASYAVMTTAGRPGRKPIFYARWHPAGAGAAQPALTLDLVPTGQPGEVRVFFRGQPLPDAAATLVTPDGKSQELKADSQGFLRFTSSQSGFHHLSVGRHREALAGFHGGQSYEATSHNASLTWNQT